MEISHGPLPVRRSCTDVVWFQFQHPPNQEQIKMMASKILEEAKQDQTEREPP